MYKGPPLKALHIVKLQAHLGLRHNALITRPYMT